MFWSFDLNLLNFVVLSGEYWHALRHHRWPKNGWIESEDSWAETTISPAATRDLHSGPLISHPAVDLFLSSEFLIFTDKMTLEQKVLHCSDDCSFFTKVTFPCLHYVESKNVIFAKNCGEPQGLERKYIGMCLLNLLLSRPLKGFFQFLALELLTKFFV